MEKLSGFDSEMLRIYYAKLFPYAEIYQWLSYGNGKNFPGSDNSYLSRREFSFTLDQDIYVRYQSFRDQAEMEQIIREKCPHKIDIGPVFNVDPAKRSAYQNVGSETLFAPVERELVFDVDISDYDDVRSCCKGADICSKCWPLMTAAIKVLDHSLRNDFGFSHLLWVFSGRRGVHCWVCDERARKLTNEQRSAVAEYFRLYKGSENNSRRVTLPHSLLHPLLSGAYKRVLKSCFEDVMLPGQSLLSCRESSERILGFIPDQEVVESIVAAWEMSDERRMPEEKVELERWKSVVKKVNNASKKNLSLKQSVEEIIFTYTFPRLDSEVSKHMNHLLKAPFCIHPKTGKVCVPIDPQVCEHFDPNNVPTLAQLLNDMNCRDAAQGGMQEGSGEPSFEAAIELFREGFLKPLLRDTKSERLQKHLQEVQGVGSSVAW